LHGGPLYVASNVAGLLLHHHVGLTLIEPVHQLTAPHPPTSCPPQLNRSYSADAYGFSQRMQHDPYTVPVHGRGPTPNRDRRGRCEERRCRPRPRPGGRPAEGSVTHLRRGQSPSGTRTAGRPYLAFHCSDTGSGAIGGASGWVGGPPAITIRPPPAGSPTSRAR
jgi:hypothetical protein